MATEAWAGICANHAIRKGHLWQHRQLINPEADEAGESAGKRTGGSLVKTIGKVLVAAGIGKLISSAISQGGELSRTWAAPKAVFGSFAKKYPSFGI